MKYYKKIPFNIYSECIQTSLHYFNLDSYKQNFFKDNVSKEE